MPERAVYVERTWAPAWVLILIWAACLVGMVSMIYGAYTQAVLGRPFGNDPGPTWLLVGSSVIFLLIPTLITLLGSRLDVEVWRDRVIVAFGPLRAIRRSVPYEEIEEIEAVTYRPIRDFGGWGIRFRPGRTAWTVRGNKAVRLRLDSGRDFYVGSRFPHRLAERIEVAQQFHEPKSKR